MLQQKNFTLSKIPHIIKFKYWHTQILPLSNIIFTHLWLHGYNIQQWLGIQTPGLAFCHISVSCLFSSFLLMAVNVFLALFLVVSLFCGPDNASKPKNGWNVMKNWKIFNKYLEDICYKINSSLTQVQLKQLNTPTFDPLLHLCTPTFETSAFDLYVWPLLHLMYDLYPYDKFEFILWQF